MNRSSQRDAILEALRSVTSHPTADEIYAMVHDTMPKLSLATVYRNLEQLTAAGMVTAVDGAGPRRFDGNTIPHHHQRCQKCGKVSDLVSGELAALDRMIDQLLPTIGCHSCHIEFSGICKHCNSASEKYGFSES